MTADNPANAWEAAIVEALVSQALQPRLMGFNPDGHGGHVPYLTTSPLAGIVDTLWARNRDQIINAVITRLDLDTLGTKIADKVIADLTTRTDGSLWGSTANQARDRIRKAADEKVAAALAERMLADITANRPDTGSS